MKKYELTDETIEFKGHTLYRIKAVREMIVSKTEEARRKALDKFLRSPFSKPKFNGTNWEYIVMIWNMNNSQIEVDEKLKQPDYRTIN